MIPTQSSTNERTATLHEVQYLVSLQENAIAGHPQPTNEVFQKARDAFLHQEASTDYTLWLPNIPTDEAVLVSRYMLTSSFISAWYHLSGENGQRDKAAHSCCILVESLSGVDGEQVMTRYIDIERMWRGTMIKERIAPRRPFPIWSTVALLVPAWAYWRITSLGADFPSRIGYTIAQLGYVLLVAGIISGSFAILGLRTRGRVIAAAVVAWLLGTALSNL